MNAVIIQQNNHGKDYWGPRMWYIIHKISYSYPESPSSDVKKTYLNFFNLTVRVIPCPYCKEHFHTAMYVKNFNNALEGRAQLIDWLKNQHNEVNISNGKRVYQGFELDMMYANESFRHDYANELIRYILELTYDNTIKKKDFILWILLLYKLHPCKICRVYVNQYIGVNNIARLNYEYNQVLKSWVEGLIFSTRNH